MDVTLRFKLDDPSGRVRLFTKKVTRPYRSVPRVGDAVFPGERLVPDHIPPRRVTDVIHLNDGSVILDLQMEGLELDPAPQVQVLLEEGYMEGRGS